MALLPGDLARAVISGVGHATREFQTRQSATGSAQPLTGREIAQWLYRSFHLQDGQPYSSYVTAGTRVAQALALAQAMTDNPGGYTTARDTPIVPSISRLDGRYSYRVVVTYGGADGREERVPGVVRSAVPLSFNQVLEQVYERIDYYDSGSRSAQESIARLGANQAVHSVELIYAVRHS